MLKNPILMFKFLFLIFQLPCFILGSWYDQKLEGWYYFEDKPSDQENTPANPEEADQRIAIESIKLKKLLSLALINPSPKNVEAYMRAQRLWIQQSNTFAQAWGNVLLEHPELGEFLTTPTSSFGILAKRALDVLKREELLRKASENYFLLFFFKGRDPMSSKVAEVVQLFASTNGWKYKAVSLDGQGTPLLKEFEIDKGISQNLGAQVSPSLFIINPTNNQVYPVGAGFISVSELEMNIENQLGDEND